MPQFSDPESSKLEEKPESHLGNTDLEVCLWRVNEKVPERKIDEFVTTAFREHGWSQEQALGILFLKNFNFRKAIDLRHTFEPVESVLETFTDDDKNAFFYATKQFGRDFGQIQSSFLKKKYFFLKILIYVFRNYASQEIIRAYYFLLSLEKEIRIERKNQISYNWRKNLRLSND